MTTNGLQNSGCIDRGLWRRGILSSSTDSLFPTAHNVLLNECCRGVVGFLAFDYAESLSRYSNTTLAHREQVITSWLRNFQSPFSFLSVRIGKKKFRFSLTSEKSSGLDRSLLRFLVVSFRSLRLFWFGGVLPLSLGISKSFFFLFVLRMRWRTYVATGWCYLRCSVWELMGPLESGPHPCLLDENGFACLGSMLLFVVLPSKARLRMSHLKPHLELFKQVSVHADQLSFPHSQSPLELEWIQ